MRCDETRRFLQESLDGMPMPREALGHIDACAACQAHAAGLAEVDAFLREETVLEWDSHLTENVVAGVRRRRRSGRLMAAAAAVLVAAAAWIGADLLPEMPAMEDARRDLAERFPLPSSPSEALSALASGLTTVVEEISAATGQAPVAPGAPVALAALLLLLLLNGLVIGRPLLARRRHE
jgi:hypothetical protein